VHLTERGRRAARGFQRGNVRRLMPVAVAGFAATGTIAGVLVAVTSGSPRNDFASATARPAITAGGAHRGASSLFNLPNTRPASGNLPDLPSLISGALLTDVNRPAVGVAPVAPLRRSLQADILVVAPSTLSHRLLDKISGLRGVTATERIEAVRMKVNGAYTAVLGVDPSVFRSFAARQTGASNALWQGVANGGIAVSYTMGQLDKLPLGGKVTAAGKKTEQLPVVAFGTLGVGGVNAVVSDSVARSLGAPEGNAIVISAQASELTAVQAAVGRLVPHSASVEQLVTMVRTGGGTTEAAGSGTAGTGAASEAAVPGATMNAALKAAMSRLGMPYVWGAAGPTRFDCSGLVQWAFARAGVVMPRVAADQALTGPAVPVSQLQAGDLLFYHTDPTDPTYISHVAMYLGNGWMIQAPEPGKNVEVVPADFGSEFAGAVRVNPAQAAAVAARLA
jgi:cell wall-associated NlpC family hydrolase